MPEMSRTEYRDFLMEGTRTAKLATARKDGRPHVAPVWFVMDEDDLIFMTGRDTVKGHAIRRDGRVALCVDDEREPYAFALVEGTATVSEDPEGMLGWSTRIARRYVGEGKAERYGRRNAVPGEMLVRVAPTKVIAESNVAGE